MRPPTRMPSRPRNPYDELAALADPDPDLDPAPRPRILPLDLGRLHAEEDEPWSPPDHRRSRNGRRARRSRRRRRSPLAALPRLAKLLFALVVGVGFLALADRCAVMYAEKKAQRALQDELHLAAAPQVDIHGFPFLTQVLDKHLNRVDVTVPHVAADRVSLTKVQASARDIKLTGDLPSDIRSAVIGDLDGRVTLSFDDMNRELTASRLKFSRVSDDTVGADGKLSIAGQELRVRARAQVRLVGTSGLSTDVDGMSLDMPGIATYRPGRDRGLTLHRESAELISRDTARVKALLSVPHGGAAARGAGEGRTGGAAERREAARAGRHAPVRRAADAGQPGRRGRRPPLAAVQNRHRPETDHRPAGHAPAGALRPAVLLVHAAEGGTGAADTGCPRGGEGHRGDGVRGGGRGGAVTGRGVWLRTVPG